MNDVFLSSRLSPLLVVVFIFHLLWVVRGGVDIAFSPQVSLGVLSSLSVGPAIVVPTLVFLVGLVGLACLARLGGGRKELVVKIGETGMGRHLWNGGIGCLQLWLEAIPGSLLRLGLFGRLWIVVTDAVKRKVSEGLFGHLDFGVSLGTLGTLARLAVERAGGVASKIVNSGAESEHLIDDSDSTVAGRDCGIGTCGGSDKVRERTRWTRRAHDTGLSQQSSPRGVAARGGVLDVAIDGQKGTPDGVTGHVGGIGRHVVFERVGDLVSCHTGG